jgi:preprotein translocase subunit SecG
MAVVLTQKAEDDGVGDVGDPVSDVVTAEGVAEVAAREAVILAYLVAHGYVEDDGQ